MEFLNRLGIARVAAMGVVTVMLLGFFAFLILRFTAPQMAPVYTGLDFDDSAAIVGELKRLNIPYELRGEGDSILVPRDQITSVRMSLAESGLPSRGQVGYEIFDQQNTLGATSFVQNVNKLRALEGELARTIASLTRVRSARVHLVIPERELFRREAKAPSASIVLEVRGALSAGEIRAVQHLVASAIDGLTPNQVSIVDASGQLLATGTTGEDGAAVASLYEERTLAFENRTRQRLEDMLANIVGPGRARVQVSAELDMNRMTQTTESYDPDGQVVRSAQTRESSDAASGGRTNGGVSVANELPGSDGGSNAAGSNTQQSSITEETINYDISKTTQTVVTEAGAIKRLSVAVVVDGTYVSDAGGSATYTPRSAEELAQIESLVRSAIGFEEGRGDQVEVVNLQFAERPDLQLPPSEASLFDFTRDDIMSGAEMAVTLLIALALVFFIMRPLVRRVLEPEPEPVALPGGQQVMMSAEGGGEMGEDMQLPEVDPRAEAQAQANNEWMDKASKLGEAQFKTIQRVGSLVEENPKQASLIIRDWLNQAA
jgi:flagellar M-ring protein FliF